MTATASPATTTDHDSRARTLARQFVDFLETGVVADGLFAIFFAAIDY